MGEWFDQVNSLMDEKYTQLEKNPATDVFGRNRGYPIEWAGVCGRIQTGLDCKFFEQDPESVSQKLISGWNPKAQYR